MTTDATDDLDERDRAVINAFQGGFPVVRRPFEPATEALRIRGVDLDASDLLDRVRRLDASGVLTRFGPLIDAEAIGGRATLVAMHAPSGSFDAIADTINDHREVAYSYEHEHPHLNVWFVVSVADPDRVDDVLATIEEETGRRTYELSPLREFRGRATFPLDGPLADEGIDLSHLGPTPAPIDRDVLTPDERDLVLAVQDGLPLTETPYADVADEIDVGVGWVIETLRRFNVEGKIRRMGVVPNHHALGYTENGMTVWDVPDDLVEEVGPEIAELDFVTRCHERPRHPGVWPYNLFAMTHGRTEAEIEARIRAVRDRLDEHFDVDEEDWNTLYSTRVLKRTGIRLEDRMAARTSAQP